jgi:flagellar biosynthetic protein FliP
MITRYLRRLAVLGVLGAALLLGGGTAPASAAPPAPAVPGAPAVPAAPTPPVGPVTGTTGTGSATVGVTVNGPDGKPSSSIVILLALTVLSVAPALLLMCTSFTKIFVVLSIVRNALGLTSVPPNQVLAGLALFLSLFIMGPVLTDVNKDGVQPYLHGTKSQSVAFHDGVAPLRTFMLDHTRKDEIALFTKVSKSRQPASPKDVPLTTLIPAFVLSELRAAFIIGFVVYIPFLVIDMVVSASLMSMGMMMLPPVTVSLPFKLLLFVLVNGWGLVISALVASY